MAEQRRRIELVESPGGQANESLRVGLGLLLGLVVGRKSLIAAATGTEQIEFAMAHFVFVVLIAVGGFLFAGALYDRYSQRAQIEAAIRRARAEAESLAGPPTSTGEPPT